MHYRADKNALIFSVTEKEHFKVKNHQKAILCDSLFGPSFGGCISSLNDLRKVLLVFEDNYHKPKGIKRTEMEASKYFAGSKYQYKQIKIIELEVFKLI